MTQRSKGFPLQWTRNLTGTDAKNFENLVRNSQLVLGRLKQIISEELAVVETEETSSSTFETPNWALKQAYLLGLKAGLKKVDKLLPEPERKKNE